MQTHETAQSISLKDIRLLRNLFTPSTQRRSIPTISAQRAIYSVNMRPTSISTYIPSTTQAANHPTICGVLVYNFSIYQR
jgi:hypothetical protein